MAFLLVVTGPNEGDYHPLKKQRVTVGRSEECTIQIVDGRVSREHMHVVYDEPAHAYQAADNGSANGVFVNDRQIAETQTLRSGDLIRIGDSEIIFSEEDFIDRDTALEHYRRRSERDRDTIMG